MWSPQGSVLGPLLFLIYANDFQKCSDLLEFHLFADDTNLFPNNANIHDLESNINSELEKVNTWLCANKLSLNLEKTSFVIFHPPQKHIHYKVRLQISNKLLKQDSHIKYLGIIFDSHLNWKKHIHELGKKISKSVGILSKIRHFVSIDILIQLYYCFVYSLITYGILVWGNTYETSLKSHQYRTRLASKASHYTAPIRTNYGKFSIKFMGPTVWNQNDEKLKNSSLKSFKQKMKESFLETYSKH